jgi:hypothetical protein
MLILKKDKKGKKSPGKIAVYPEREDLFFCGAGTKPRSLYMQAGALPLSSTPSPF